jgi:hypothetical protein
VVLVVLVVLVGVLAGVLGVVVNDPDNAFPSSFQPLRHRYVAKALLVPCTVG